MALADVLGFDSVDFLKNIDPLSPAYSAFHDGFGNLANPAQLQVPPYENVSCFVMFAISMTLIGHCFSDVPRSRQ